ncbi:MAG: signal peptidase I [Chloroflexi bacterium]|nr:signal peptidase I [Chloroflexota bacterium]
MLTIARRGLEVALLVLVLGTLGLAALAQAAPLLGGGLYTVRSESMAPTLGVGDLVVVEEVAPESIAVGDVITIKLASGSTVTHRVAAVLPTDGQPMFQTRGDANGGPDPVRITADQVVGRLAWHLPLLGFILAMLSMPTGLAALFSVGATLLTAIWLLDEVEVADEDDELEPGDGAADPEADAPAPAT